MASRRYAEGTTVGIDQTLNQIRKLLLVAGATSYAYGEGPDGAGIQFALNGLHYKFMVKRPTWADLYDRYRDPRRVDQSRAVDDEWRRRWRARLLWIKAMLEFAEVEPDAFAEAMLGNLVLPDGQRLAEWSIPQIEAAYSGGKMPPLLLGTGSEG